MAFQTQHCHSTTQVTSTQARRKYRTDQLIHRSLDTLSIKKVGQFYMKTPGQYWAEINSFGISHQLFRRRRVADWCGRDRAAAVRDRLGVNRVAGFPRRAGCRIGKDWRGAGLEGDLARGILGSHRDGGNRRGRGPVWRGRLIGEFCLQSVFAHGVVWNIDSFDQGAWNFSWCSANER